MILNLVCVWNLFSVYRLWLCVYMQETGVYIIAQELQSVNTFQATIKTEFGKHIELPGSIYQSVSCQWEKFSQRLTSVGQLGE